jgi:hypothetical protein
VGSHPAQLYAGTRTFTAQIGKSHPKDRGDFFRLRPLPRRMPRPDSHGRYFFDTGHEPGREDDSYIRFSYRNGKIWLTEVTAWAEAGRMP